MKKTFVVLGGLVFLLLLLGVGSALAQNADEGEGGGEPAVTPEKPASKPLFGSYGVWFKRQEKILMNLPLWGASMTLPEGYGIVFAGWQTRRPAQRFDKDRKIDDVVPVISAPDPFEKKGKFFTFDFGVSGSGQGIGAGFQYGVTDHLTVGINTYALMAEIKIDPIFTPGSSDQVGIVTLDDFYTILTQMGRPIPVTKYKSDPIDLGDTTLEAKWNFFRSEYVASALQGGVFLPTAHRAKPNSAIIFGLGPDLDTGTASWGGKIGAVLDLRPPDPVKWISFTLQADGAYFLESSRKAPNFPPQNQDVKDYLKSQGVDVNIFPDLSDISSRYYYMPGPWCAFQAGIGMGPAGIAYRHGFGGAATFRTSSPGLKQLIKEIGLSGYGDDGKLIFNFNVPLTPLYIPGLISFNFEYSTDGRNFLIFRDVYTIGVGVGFPINTPSRYK